MASLFNPPLPPNTDKPLHWSGLHGSALSLAISHAARHNTGPVVVVTRDLQRARILDAELQFYLAGQKNPTVSVLRFPDWECLPYDHFSPHPDIVSERLRTLTLLPELQKAIVTLSVANLMQRLPPLDYVLGHSFSLNQGQRLDTEALRRQLQQAAYQAVSQVMAPGEFAVRGGLIDIFPMGAEAPFRLDMFGDEIESIRFFDPESQRSQDKAEAIQLLPAREFPLTDEGVRQFRQSFRRQFEGDPQKHQIYREVSKGNAPAGLEFFFPLFFEQTNTLFDYLPNTTSWILDWELQGDAEVFYADVKDRFQNANLDIDRKVLSPETLYLRPEELSTNLKKRLRIRLDDKAKSSSINFDTCAPPELPADPKHESPYRTLFEHLQGTSKRTLLVAETPGRREMLEGLLLDHDLLPTPVDTWQGFCNQTDLDLAITVSDIERGLELTDSGISLITESQVYGERVQQRRRRSEKSRDPDTIIRSLAELKINDPVAHDEHGVGRYLGLQTLGINGEETEFLTLEYQDGDKLYVPVLSLHLIGRYIGGDTEHAPLHKLGGDAWTKSKQRAERKAYDVAAELLEIESLRAGRVGFAFTIPEPAYNLFEAKFPFEETPDQAHAIQQVLDDLESIKPMDRLVCGDVGFGKTEVALRAAFIVVNNHKQVAMLVPTTLLAQQHFQTFQDRFADLPFTVELLSRFRSKNEITELTGKLSTGYPDILIGTHRLLQDDIRFKDLGLLIIDEEHRFGVRQKEKLKKFRSQVDILTLTATPIPRTLNMAMSGLREISVIATPPRARLSIKTSVRPYNKALIRESCLREVRRGGQVYFLHNEVRTIESVAAELQKLLPEASVEFAHGQMPEYSLERVMRDFYHQRFNVLVCTTIIESGIDIPSANTIIINRAQRFGLAQLHQLRGRVGRSHHQAFAYLLIPNKESLTADAEKRLDAIEKLEDLGAGFALASHDLEIRGAGELLGDTQSGLIDEIGFSLYTTYLDRAIKALRAQKQGADSGPVQTHQHLESINLHASALFPENYLPDVHSRLVLYKRLASVDEKNELYELQIEVTDRFGRLPEASKTLFRLHGLRLMAQKADVHKIDIGAMGGRIQFNENPNIDPAVIMQLVQDKPDVYSLADNNSLRIKTTLAEVDGRVGFVEELLTTLNPVQD